MVKKSFAWLLSKNTIFFYCRLRWILGKKVIFLGTQSYVSESHWGLMKAKISYKNFLFFSLHVSFMLQSVYKYSLCKNLYKMLYCFLTIIVNQSLSNQRTTENNLIVVQISLRSICVWKKNERTMNTLKMFRCFGPYSCVLNSKGVD